MTESFSLFTPTQVTFAALAERAASASDASEDASAERYFTPTRGGSSNLRRGWRRESARPCLASATSARHSSGSREPVDYLPAAARVAGFRNAPDDTLARRRMGRARLSVVLLLIMKNPVEISVDWQHRRTATGLLRRRGVFPGHIERINPLLAPGG